MDNKEKLPVVMQYDEAQTIPLAVHEMHMARNDRRATRERICWASAVIALVVVGTYERLQYDYVSTESTSTEYSGVYNLVDAEGNVISSDLLPEDVVRIMEALNNGEGETKADANTQP